MKPARSLIEGDDGLPAEEVGVWVLEKHTSLKRYLDISRAARQKFLGEGNAGATYVDLFCGTGRARIRETGAWIDGSAVSAWKIARGGRAPFSEILVADVDRPDRSTRMNTIQNWPCPAHGAHMLQIAAIALVAGSFFNEKYSETPFAVSAISCPE